MPDTLKPSVPPRATRTYELRDEQWIETGARLPRPSPWLLVPVVLAGATVAMLALFAVVAALLTGGLLDVRRRVLSHGARLRERLSQILRR